MPLSKAKQAEYMRNKRLKGVIPKSINSVIPKIEGLILDGHKILGVAKTELVQPIPIYNPRIHKLGDVVRKWVKGRYVEVTVPEIDADGNPIPE